MENLSTFFLYGVVTYLNSLVLISFIFGAVGFSTYYYNRARGSNQTDSANAAMMLIFLIIGFMLFYVGAYFVSNPDKQLTEDVSGIGWGLIGFGFSIISLSFSFFSNIESQRNVEMIKVFLFEGRRRTRRFKSKLNSRELFKIGIIWYVFTILTWIYCIVYSPQFLIFPIVVMYAMLFICIGLSILSVHRDEVIKQGMKTCLYAMLQWIRRQVVKYCIFCYLFPEIFPEVNE